MPHSLALPSSAQLVAAPGGLEFLEIRSAQAQARIYVQGAHVQSFQPTSQAEAVLFHSQKSFYEVGRAIRGGVPLIFPWFGPHPSRPELPAHGLVRTRNWQLDSVQEQQDGTVIVEWSARDDEETREQWKYEYLLRYQVTIGQELTMSLEVENRSSSAFVYEEALHTYLRVSDARNAMVRGLRGTEYLDKVEAMARKTEHAQEIAIEAETDRIYLDTEATCWIDDPSFSRTLEIAKTGSQTSVLWNPWIKKAAALADFEDNEWTRMICIETANAAENAILLEPGARHKMSAIVRVHPLHA